MATAPTAVQEAPAHHPSELHDGGIKVTAVGICDRIFWDALLLYGEERYEEVKALARANLEKGGRSAILLGIGLARLDNDERTFEDLAVQFAVETDQSPPVWMAQKAPKKVDDGGKHSVVTISTLSADNIIEATIKLETPRPITIDFGGVSKIEALGIDLFNESLTARMERKEETKLVNSDRIINALCERLQGASVISQPGVWNCVFNLMLLAGKKEAFEKLALDYAQKTGQKMQWRDLHKHADDSEGPSVTVGVPAGERLRDLGSDAFIKSVLESPVTVQARERQQPVAIDFAATRKWDLLDGTNVAHFLRAMSKDKILVRFINVNELLEALLRCVGVARHVEIYAPGAIT